jgi:hypothetical protein
LLSRTDARLASISLPSFLFALSPSILLLCVLHDTGDEVMVAGSGEVGRGGGSGSVASSSFWIWTGSVASSSFSIWI